MSWNTDASRRPDAQRRSAAKPRSATPPATRRGRWLAGAGAAGLLALSLIGGCSSTDDFFSGQPAPNGTASSFTDRFRNLFGASEAEAPAAAPASPSTAQINCPTTDIRQGASTLQMTAPGNDGAMGVRFQATFGRTARQCIVADGNVTIKVGVQGRLILGPAGAPGATTVPLRYALVREGIEPKTIWSKLYNVPVDVPAGQPNVPFTHVVEDLVIPMPPGDEIDRYVIYVGFDPKGAAEEKPPKRRRVH